MRVSGIDPLMEGWKLIQKMEYMDKARLISCGLIGEDASEKLFLKDAEGGSGAGDRQIEKPQPHATDEGMETMQRMMDWLEGALNMLLAYRGLGN